VREINLTIVYASGVLQLTLILFFVYLINMFFNTYPLREDLTFGAVVVTMVLGDLFILSHIKQVEKYNERIFNENSQEGYQENSRNS
jgi:hypothetical protein